MRPEQLPNIITASRIVLTPLFIYLLMSGDGVMVQASAGVFLVAAISDWYDGWYARKYNAMSSFGRFFDPLADKVLIGAAFFAFAFLDILSLWMVLAIVGRGPSRWGMWSGCVSIFLPRLSRGCFRRGLSQPPCCF